MASHIEFDISHPNKITSYCPFEKEWQRLEEVKAAVEIGRRKIVALKSSNIEFFIPQAFRVLFFLIGLVVVLAVIFNWTSFVNSWTTILRGR